MPYRPQRPCSHPSCPKLTDGRFCEEHAKEEAKRYERYQRDPAVKKRYGRMWKCIRDHYIAAHPLCTRSSERLPPAQEVHHIKPLSQGGTNAEDNLMSLCTSCHSKITAREGGRRVCAGDKPQPLADKITAGKAAKILEALELHPESLLEADDWMAPRI